MERLKRELPANWYAFSNLDLVLGLGKSREIDMIIVADHRIYFIDLKDWNGVIENREGRWYHNGKDSGPSPVQKIGDITREILTPLGNALKARSETRKEPTPPIFGFVVVTGSANISALDGQERAKVVTADEFIAMMTNGRKQIEIFGEPFTAYLRRPLTDSFWKDKLSRFFNVGPNSPFQHGRRRFQGYLAEDRASYSHPSDVYREYEAAEEGNKNNLGVLRLWDFTKCNDPRFLTEEGRLEIAGREKLVYHWLRDRDQDLERTLLTPRVEDTERGVNYWEIYDRRRRMRRLNDFATSDAATLLPGEKVELARQVLSAVASMHRQNSAHLDLGGHSIWLELPTSVRLSHLLAARFPDGKSLGPARYQFLASVTVPEDVLNVDMGPKRRDVFLLGVAIHLLLFSELPQGEPAEWRSEVDKNNQYPALHPWFAEALEVSPDQRFSDAVVALDAFNRATASRPALDEVIEGLESFRTSIRNQRQLFSVFPVDGDMIIESDRLDVWRSSMSGLPVLVKQWKQAAWGDLKREGAAVLAFLRKAYNLKADKLPGIASVRDVHWLNDSLVLVQQWIHGTSLADLLASSDEEVVVAEKAIDLATRLVSVVANIHESGFAHGDLKPANVIVTSDGEPVLIDVLDFSTHADGQLETINYAPESGTRFERDRYALTKILEEILEKAANIDASTAEDIAVGIRHCREKAPILTTLLPIQEALARAVERRARIGAPETQTLNVAVSIAGQATGLIDSDEGFLFLRTRRHPVYGSLSLLIRGAFEEVEVRLDKEGKATGATRRRLEQFRVSQIAKHEFHKMDIALIVRSAEFTDLSELTKLFSDPIVRARIDQEISGSAPAPDQGGVDGGDVVLEEDEAEDELAEEISEVEPSSPSDIDVPKLWRTLIDVENEQTTEGVAQLDSIYDRNIGRHKIVFELESGEFDFSRFDTVGVQKQDKRGNWHRIGELDLSRSRPDHVFLDTQGNGYLGPRFVEAGQRLRFLSHFVGTSLKRRTDAVDRILLGNGRAKNLLAAFDPRSQAVPDLVEWEVSDDALALYELNEDQKEALRNLVRVRPLGLLQGPPGTGKTRFIAALAHLAISTGKVRNVLLSSQSHEAVNTAAEAVLRLFRKKGELPSLLRVGMDDGQVSEQLRPYHTSRVEQSYKDRFTATFGDRMAIAGRGLGLPSSITSEITTLELTVRPVLDRISELCRSEKQDLQRLHGLIETLKEHLSLLHVDVQLPDGTFDDDWNHVLEDASEVISRRAARQNAVSSDKIGRLRAIAGLGRDFVGSVSRAERSFDTFLAGTRQIVAGTCVGLGRSSLGLTTTAFDLVIIDEAARCTSGELLVPLQAARWAVLVGDQAQLQPQHRPEVVSTVAERASVAKSDIMRSDFERVFETPYGKLAGARLKTQYRMLPPIGQLVSEVFYADLSLSAGRSVPDVDPQCLPAELSKPLVWVNTDDLGEVAYERKESNSKVNPVEADAILRLLERWHAEDNFRQWLLTQQTHPIGIGVICMYAAQRNLIERKLRQSSLASLLDRQVKVGTVDSYQGKENPIVVLSLVRNNALGPQVAGKRSIKEGFLTTPNRINVAVSRAMDRLVVVGARQAWVPHNPMGRLSAGFSRRVDDGTAIEIPVGEIIGASSNHADGTLARDRAKKGVPVADS